jgi:hypothetical protein
MLSVLYTSVDHLQLAESIGKLRQLKVVPENCLSAYLNRAEELRALVNHRCVGMLNRLEEHDAYRFADMARTDEQAGTPISEVPPVLAEPLQLSE